MQQAEEQGGDQDTRGGGYVTQLLVRAGRGDAAATDELFPLVYDELRSVAAAFLARERAGHTLQPTALVNEAYVRLIGPSEVSWENRAHFFGAAARAIRRILTDHARARGREKRGGGMGRVPLDQVDVAIDFETLDLVALDEALTKLAGMDQKIAKVVELRFFGGLTEEETARALGVSASTVTRDWRFARSWLRRELSGEAGGEA
jgi:RNA polymerase sigma-70 factor (ECF subfamily)